MDVVGVDEQRQAVIVGSSFGGLLGVNLAHQVCPIFPRLEHFSLSVVLVCEPGGSLYAVRFTHPVATHFQLIFSMVEDLQIEVRDAHSTGQLSC